MNSLFSQIAIAINIKTTFSNLEILTKIESILSEQFAAVLLEVASILFPFRNLFI